MIRVQLLRTLAYIWVAFGAYWMGASLFKTKFVNARTDQRGKWARILFLAVTLALLFCGRRVVPPALLIVLGVAWGALGLYWATPAKSERSGEFPLYRALRLIVLGAVFALLFWDRTGVSWLGKRFVPATVAFAVAGFLFALTGLGIALWARIHLGAYWSDKVVLQAGHQLIRTGPYTCMRHPIYSGVLLAVAGTAVVVGEWRGVLAFGILLINYSIKARREDRILAEAFSAAFSEHKGSAGFLLPNFRHRH